MLRCSAPPPPSRRQPAYLLRDRRLFPSSKELLAELAGAGRIAEFGTYKGEFAKQIFVLQPPGLHVIDIVLVHVDYDFEQQPRASRLDRFRARGALADGVLFALSEGALYHVALTKPE